MARERRLIGAVILDAGGVILHPDFDWLSARAAEHGASLTQAGLHQAYYRMIHAVDLDDRMAREGMAVSSDDVRRYLMTQLLIGCRLSIARAEELAPVMARAAAERFPRESDIFHWSMPGTRERLERLQDAGFRLALASNNDGALAAQLSSVGLSDLFSVALDSGVEGVAKPEPELLLRAARAIAVEPDACLFVGDIDRVDGRAARAAKMAFALLDPLRQPRASKPLTIESLDQIHEHFRAA